MNNGISVCSSDAVSFLLVLEPNTPEKSDNNSAVHGASSESRASGAARCAET